MHCVGLKACIKDGITAVMPSNDFVLENGPTEFPSVKCITDGQNALIYTVLWSIASTGLSEHQVKRFVSNQGDHIS